VPHVGFKPTIPEFEREMPSHASDLAVTVIGLTNVNVIEDVKRAVSSKRSHTLHSCDVRRKWDLILNFI
jgi:hypothetical protein